MEVQATLNVQPVSGDVKVDFQIQLFEMYGQCCVRMSQASDFRPKESKLVLCEGNANVQNFKDDIWWGPVGTKPDSNVIVGQDIWRTSQPWGKNYSAALIAKNNGNSASDGDYKIVVSTPVTR